MKEVLIGLGSNLGDRAGNIEKALDLVNQQIGQVNARSSWIESEPWGYQSSNWFLNRVVVVDFDESLLSSGIKTNTLCNAENPEYLKARELLRSLREIETASGRVRTVGYTDRMIDLDILFYGNAVIDSQELTVPHPHLHERRFILVSLMELCPDRIHPRLGETIRELMEKCTDRGLVRIIKGHGHR